MHKLLFIIAIFAAACSNTADTSKNLTQSASAAASRRFCLPSGFTVVEKSSDGYFIRLSSAEQAPEATIRELADSLSGYFDRVDLCLDVAHERGDEYISIIDRTVFDYSKNRIYSLNPISK